ncbi:hypothetical protein [Coraliomargarita parva]|uniref:hypothetical protein n=1 Tax=Coraliomargarita parva TaxID=3014050 RepID=UPI0022B30FC7|nr:hypothetical protein [Coraliomargarita parva]
MPLKLILDAFTAANDNPFGGETIKDRPSLATVHGEIVAREGGFVGKLDHCQLLKRGPTRFQEWYGYSPPA